MLAVKVGLVTNVFLAVLKTSVGIIGHSPALLADGINSTSDVAYYLGSLWSTTDYLEAEKYFRIAFKYDPLNTEKMGALAWVLILNVLKLDEGLQLMQQAIESDPGNALLIHQQGYGFYQKGNFEDALFNLYNAKELYQDYSYELQNHIILVENAIAEQRE